VGRTFIIGRGAWGAVHKAKLKHSETPVAMKMLPVYIYANEQNWYEKLSTSDQAEIYPTEVVDKYTEEELEEEDNIALGKVDLWFIEKMEIAFRANNIPNDQDQRKIGIALTNLGGKEARWFLNLDPAHHNIGQTRKHR
jgi:hypothetical protein